MDTKLYFKCPGNDPVSRAFPELFTCPDCGTDVEMWMVENKGKCASCSRVFQKNKIIEIKLCLL